MRRTPLILFTFAAVSLVTPPGSHGQTPAAAPTRGNITPPPDLNTVEECQRADLSRYWGSTFRFHLYDCWADVTFDDAGKVLAFAADDVAACERVLEECRPR
jgi:hypothetical protein